MPATPIGREHPAPAIPPGTQHPVAGDSEGVDTQTSYDEVAYPGISHAQTHPDRLATLAFLLGLEPAPVSQCRVLELGCGSGGNLIPMASGLPSSQFVGIDLSTGHIEAARANAGALGLRNVTFEAQDVADVTPGDEPFDYIIVHGMYSWVPRPVQQRILEICRENLSPNGVAYVSYNTYPGWHQMHAVRDVMRYHTRTIADPERRAASARGVVRFLADTQSDEETPYATFLKAYDAFLHDGMQVQGSLGDALLLHNELGEVNVPLYFYQFVEEAARHGLQYLVETDLSSVSPESVSPEHRPLLLRLAGDIVELEQYLDFIHNRSFRRTLLCRREAAVVRTLDPKRLMQLYVASPATLQRSDDAGAEAGGDRFVGADGSAMETGHPLVRAAMRHLIAAWPRRVHFRDLVEHCAASLERETGQAFSPQEIHRQALGLGAALLKAYSRSSRLVTLHTFEPAYALEVSDCPTAIAAARLQAREGRIVTNVKHERVTLTPFQNELLPLLDGTRTRTGLLEEIARRGAGNLSGAAEQAQGEDVDPGETRLHQLLDHQLQTLARSALLVD